MFILYRLQARDLIFSHELFAVIRHHFALAKMKKNLAFSFVIVWWQRQQRLYQNVLRQLSDCVETSGVV
jgi:5-carboxymethyl-2-hydroxymuconate isomerase